ncbi:RcnB family protein [Sphingorhabdus sp. SMR4y]|uniref:RcnB family protein n=1 Tax=Sphingorhabdus sp. SMR4y TaxID=2584094 RepID=UPI000B620AAC|nr:RcnB family protein [Sphingorhabdus sp. SMR4y]ASK89399.1 nickel/cobalt transporter regulator [Sphingorhabdus sp. SMR4y]
MKKFLMAMAVTTMAVSPMVTAQAQAAPHKTVEKRVTQKNGKRVVTKTTTTRSTRQYRNDNRRYASVSQKKWTKGQRFDRRYATSYRVIDNPRAYRLSNAPRGYQWVRSGNDAVLIAVTSGIIGAVIGNAISR